MPLIHVSRWLNCSNCTNCVNCSEGEKNVKLRLKLFKVITIANKWWYFVKYKRCWSLFSCCCFCFVFCWFCCCCLFFVVVLFCFLFACYCCCCFTWLLYSEVFSRRQQKRIWFCGFLNQLTSSQIFVTFNRDLLSVRHVKYKLHMVEDGLMLASNDTTLFYIRDAVYVSWNTGSTVAVKLLMTIQRLWRIS